MPPRFASLCRAPLIIALLLFGVAGLTAAFAQPSIPEPPTLSAKSYLLMDHHTGRVLASANADEPLEPASLTKILTAYTVFHELASGGLALTDEVLVSERAWRTKGSRTFIEVGSRVTVEDLLMGMIVQSGNDASVALAEKVAGTEAAFADLMNAHAQRLGASNSHFTNATGLPSPDLYTTARDIGLITSAMIREFPEQYRRYKVKEFTYNNIKQGNRNLLLYQDESVDGVKTGHTDAAGYCLVTSAKRDGMRLISVVMGTAGHKQRARESLALLNYGFRFYESHLLYDAGKAIEHLRVWKGQATEMPVGPAQDVYVTIPSGHYDGLTAGIDPRPRQEAPLARGDELGTIVISLDGNEMMRVPAVALEDLPRGNLWRLLVDTVLMLFQS